MSMALSSNFKPLSTARLIRVVRCEDAAVEFRTELDATGFGKFCFALIDIKPECCHFHFSHMNKANCWIYRFNKADMTLNCMKDLLSTRLFIFTIFKYFAQMSEHYWENIQLQGKNAAVNKWSVRQDSRATLHTHSRCITVHKYALVLGARFLLLNIVHFFYPHYFQLLCTQSFLVQNLSMCCFINEDPLTAQGRTTQYYSGGFNFVPGGYILKQAVSRHVPVDICNQSCG